MSLPVAKLQLSRNDFSHPQPGPLQLSALRQAVPVLVQEQLVKPGTDLNQVIDALIDANMARPVIAQNGAAHEQ